MEALRPYPKVDNSDLDLIQKKLDDEKNMVLSDRRMKDSMLIQNQRSREMYNWLSEVVEDKGE